MNINELPWTGERLVPSIKNYGAIEHLHRYAFAADFVENKIVADVASGEGYGSNILSQKAKMVIGIDINNEAVVHANTKYSNSKLKYLKGSADQLPLESSSIDIFVSFETIEHIITQEQMLSEIIRVLRKDGKLIISSPEKVNYQDKQTEENYFHVKELYFGEFKNLINTYFKYSVFLKQKFVNGSFIVPFEFSNSFVNYHGDYTNITKSKTIEEPTFNICIASNELFAYQECSFFDLGDFQSNIRNEYEEAYNQILNSKTYKLSKKISLPFRIIRKFLK